MIKENIVKPLAGSLNEINLFCPVILVCNLSNGNYRKVYTC